MTIDRRSFLGRAAAAPFAGAAAGVLAKQEILNAARSTSSPPSYPPMVSRYPAGPSPAERELCALIDQANNRKRDGIAEVVADGMRSWSPATKRRYMSDFYRAQGSLIDKLQAKLNEVRASIPF